MSNCFRNDLPAVKNIVAMYIYASSLLMVSHKRLHGKAPLKNLFASQGLVAETALLLVIHTATNKCHN